MEGPIIDWELGIKLAGNSAQAAEEMLVLLIKSLPNDLALIKQAYTDNQHDQLGYYVHRLHGALCYCGTPRLKAATVQLEQAIRQKNYPDIIKHFFQFESEANKLLEVCHANTSQPPTTST